MAQSVLSVEVRSCFGTVETVFHEVFPAALLQETALRHVDAGGTGHQVVAAFDASEGNGRAEVVVRADAVELQQPRLKAGSVGLARTQFTGFGVECHARLGTCPPAKAPTAMRCPRACQTGFGRIQLGSLIQNSAVTGLSGAPQWISRVTS